MLSLVLPKVERKASSQNYCQFAIGPLESGYGVTLGNALRRTLLSSLPGAAVTSLRISDVSHEFSTIPHVREDATWLILNVKRLRFQVAPDVPEEVAVRIEVRGEGPIAGGDIICPPGVDVVNPELLLLTADSSEADLDIEMVVRRGRGYLSTEDRQSERMALGEIPVDAIFSPVRRVRYNVERARIGHQGGYDRLLLDIWTDGTIAPEDALRVGAQMLVQHLVLIGGVEMVLPAESSPEDDQVPSALYDQEIDSLGLNVRVYNCLRRAGISTVGEVVKSLSRGDDELLQIRNLGAKSLEELKERLRSMDLLPSSAPAEREEDLDTGQEFEVEVEAEAASEAELEADVVMAAQSADDDDDDDDDDDEPDLDDDDTDDDADDDIWLDDEAEEDEEEAEMETGEDEGGDLRLDDALATALRKAMLRGGADS